MNWKMIIRAAFDLTDEEWDQAVKLRELGETDRGLLMERLGPQKPAAKKKSSKKAGKKSQRAQSLGEQIQRRPRGVVTGDGNEDDGRCTYKIGEDASGPIICDTLPDNNVHHKRTDPDYHPFTPAASSAPPPSDQASSGIGKDAALDAARAAAGE